MMQVELLSERVDDKVHLIIRLGDESVRIPFAHHKIAIAFGRDASERILYALQASMTEDEILELMAEQER